VPRSQRAGALRSDAEAPRAHQPTQRVAAAPRRHTGGHIELRVPVARLLDDFEWLSVHLRVLTEHSKCCWHTNLIERTFGETRRRTKVMGRLPK